MLSAGRLGGNKPPSGWGKIGNPSGLNTPCLLIATVSAGVDLRIENPPSLKGRHVAFVHLKFYRSLTQPAKDGNDLAQVRVEVIPEQRRARLRHENVRARGHSAGG